MRKANPGEEQVVKITQWPPSANSRLTHRRNRDGGIRFITSDAYRDWQQKTHLELKRYTRALNFGRCAVLIDVQEPDNRKRDLDNIFKPVLDALVAVGILVDDSDVDWLRIQRTRLGVPKGTLRVTLHQLDESGRMNRVSPGVTHGVTPAYEEETEQPKQPEESL